MSMEDDLREDCKYGSNCYQKNPAHHARFKHPPKDNNEPPPEKKRRTENPGDNKEQSVEKNKSLTVNRVFPPDFYAFYDWCETLNPSDPTRALLDTAGLMLTGNFYKLDNEMRWRFFYDPPEFLSLLVQVDSSEMASEDDEHFGYFWDDPQMNPVFVGRMRNNSCKIKKFGNNLFAAVFHWIKDLLRTTNPFQKTKLQKLKESLLSFTSSKNYTVELDSDTIKARNKKVVAHPFHGAGLVVPYDKKTCLGYREIPESTTSLKKMFKKAAECTQDDEDRMDAIQELVTNVQFANDEGDPGMGLELGLNLFSFENGSDIFHPVIKHLLCVAYDLLGRNHLSKVIETHLSRRKKGELVIMD